MLPISRRLLAAALCAGFAAHALAADMPTPPPTPQHPASDTLQGTVVEDPYRWLENPDDPAVQDWIAAQNRYAEAVLGAMPEGDALTARVQQLSAGTTTRSNPMLAGGMLFYLQHTPPQAQPVLMAQGWPEGAAKPLVDLNQGDGNGAITGYWPSPSGRFLVYGTAEGGSELTTLHVLDVLSGTMLDDRLAWAGGGTSPQGVAWDADEKGFNYVRFAAPADGQPLQPFNATLAHHAIGEPQDKDATVFGKGYSPIAEYVLVNALASAQSAILTHEGDGDAAEVFVRERNRYRRVLDRDANARTAAWVGQRLVVAVFRDAPRGRLVAIDKNGRSTPLLAERAGAIQQIAPLGEGFIVVRSSGPDWWAEQYDAEAKLLRRVPLPTRGIAIGSIASESGQARALISYSGWTTPTHWVEYDGESGTVRDVFAVKPPADYSKISVRQIEGTSKDGTHVPVTLLMRDGTRPDGSHPTILYGYGGFDIPLAPSFIGANLAWLEHGGVLAFANLRGGNEFGQAWHAQGQKLLKQNVFNDFRAAAHALFDTHWTRPARLGILGGSNGGLLMGASLVQHPEDYRAVVSRVGIYDMLRHESESANGKYNVSEYGSIADPAQLQATLIYSPLQNVKPQTDYPAVLLTTGANDPRVSPWQSRKFAAALQNATRSGQPILLLTRMNAGHGIGAPFSQRVNDATITLTFFAHELGLDATGAK